MGAASSRRRARVEALEDPEERAYFNELPTSLSLDDEAIDRLIATGRRLLRASPEFQRLLAGLQADPDPPPSDSTTGQGIRVQRKSTSAHLALGADVRSD